MSFQTRRINEERAPSPSPDGSAEAEGARPASLPVFGWLQDFLKRQTDGQGVRVRILKKLTTVLLSTLVILAILAGMLQILVSLKVVSLKTILTATAAELPKDSDGYTNILLLGKGDDDHDGIDLTDTMMIASFDPSRTKSVVMLSIPRDLYVTTKFTKGRINEVYRDFKAKIKREKGLSAAEASTEAMKALMAELSDDLQIQIHHAVMVNFTGFTQAVDALGGVDVTVPEDLVDHEYPGPNWTYETFEITAGVHHLDGETALKYARSRHSTSDFSRSARQQQIIQVVGDKAKEQGILHNPGKVLSLLRILSQNVETTMNYRELLGAAQMAQDIDHSRIINMQLNDRDGLYTSIPEAGGFLYDPPREDFGGASVLAPVKLPTSKDSWQQIRTFAHLLLSLRTIYLGHPTITILNAGAKAGMAATLGGELIRYGFTIDDTKNAPFPKQEASLIGMRTDADKPMATFFSSLLHLPLGTIPAAFPPKASSSSSEATSPSMITIVLGKGYKYTPIQDLLPTTP